MKFISIDFETANEKRFSPCAIGVVVSEGTKIVEEYYSLINPQMEFNSFNTYIHGITARDVAEAPTFTEIWPTFNRYLTNNLVIAHNASFDMSVIRHSLDYANLPYPEMEYLCTSNIAKRVWPDLINHKLDTIADHFNITFDHHHALEDARVAAKVLWKAMEEYETDSVDILLDKSRISKGRIFERGYTPPKMKRVKQVKTFRF